ncbi:hypothetical protein R1sor_014815 [Riccia sorocarpa]|uniref:SNARE-complex protein Syntaxin-18 N-terminal domain-containing protein n=1 Tax=Riccia sorocarpa TaxID=122646 RepID=A0ABD3HCB5_9MARC
MANAKDVTEKFREAVRSAAANQGYDEEKLANISAALIMRKSPPRSQFCATAIDILGNIRSMHTFIMAHGKDYADRYRSTEKDKDMIEHEVGEFVKTCKKRIDTLKDSIGAEDKKMGRSGWLSGLGKNGLSRDLNAHQHGMVLILSEHLHAVTAQFDQLRAKRFQESIDRRIPKRRPGLQALNKMQTGSAESSSDTRSTSQQTSTRPEGYQAQEQLDDETRALQVELSNLMDTVQETERKMLEVSALNHLFSTHVLHQAQQIELLYQQALDATTFVEKGNKELTKAIKRSSSSRLYIVLVMTVLTLTLLFLDWYQ